MISAGDFRNGVTLEIDGNVYQIMEFQHVKPGKGAAFVRTKIKNVMSGGVVEKTFRPTEKFPAARIDRVDMQYLYSDGDLYNFMDVNTYEQVGLNADTIGDALKFVKENEMCKICSYNGKVFSVEPPLFVELEITDTEPGFKGDTATGATKPAGVETDCRKIRSRRVLQQSFCLYVCITLRRRKPIIVWRWKKDGATSAGQSRSGR